MEIVSFKNFNPASRVKNFCSARVDDILEQVPTDAASSLTIEKRGRYYVGDLKIRSFGGSFRAKNAHRSLEKLTEELCQDVQHQIESWRKTRFDH
jgi:hypothetical protein